MTDAAKDHGDPPGRDPARSASQPATGQPDQKADPLAFLESSSSAQGADENDPLSFITATRPASPGIASSLRADALRTGRLALIGVGILFLAVAAFGAGEVVFARIELNDAARKVGSDTGLEIRLRQARANLDANAHKVWTIVGINIFAAITCIAISFFVPRYPVIPMIAGLVLLFGVQFLTLWLGGGPTIISIIALVAASVALVDGLRAGLAIQKKQAAERQSLSLHAS
jgi:hypothetical protein